MTKYCIQWKNSRGETHSGPELWIRPRTAHFTGDLTQEDIDKIADPRPKTYVEARVLADSMNNSPEFSNTTHKAIIYKGKRRADKPAPKGAIEEFTPVFQLPSAKAGRKRMGPFPLTRYVEITDNRNIYGVRATI